MSQSNFPCKKIQNVTIQKLPKWENDSNQWQKDGVFMDSQKKRTNKETAFGTHFCTTPLSVEHQVYCMTAC